jgi:excisionase family DNA binding protein
MSIRTDRLLSVEEAADYLSVGERFIRRIIAERRIRFFKIGKYVRLSTEDLDGFIAAAEIPQQRR